MQSTPLPRISRRLLLSVALTNGVAVLGVIVTMWVTEYLSPPMRWGAVLLLIALVAFVWISVLRRQVRQLIETPLADSIAAAESIALGDTARRVPSSDTEEFNALALSVNRMTEQLLEANVQRTRVEKLATMGRLAAGIAHEVGNPLAAIANYAHLVRTRVESAGRIANGGAAPTNIAVTIAEPLDALDREVERIDRIVRGLLDYARPRRVTPKPIVIDDVIATVLQLLADQGVTRRVQMEKEFAARDGLVYGERHDLEQVFVNLLLNAVDAMDGQGKLALRSRTTSVDTFATMNTQRRTDTPSERFPHQPNGRALSWLARADRPDAVLQVVIADSGPGVAPEDEERIFEPFYSTKQPGKGTGLGLAIVARTIDNLGGTIWVQRAREGGAAFVLLFPLHAGTQAIR